jgi:hypothetical protein
MDASADQGEALTLPELARSTWPRGTAEIAISPTIGIILGPTLSRIETESPAFAGLSFCGAYRDRTGDLRLAKPDQLCWLIPARVRFHWSEQDFSRRLRAAPTVPHGSCCGVRVDSDVMEHWTEMDILRSPTSCNSVPQWGPARGGEAFETSEGSTPAARPPARPSLRTFTTRPGENRAKRPCAACAAGRAAGDVLTCAAWRTRGRGFIAAGC